MIDKATEKALQEVGRSIPKWMLKELVKKKVISPDMNDFADAVIGKTRNSTRNNRWTVEQAQAIQESFKRLKAVGAFNKETQSEINLEVQKEIDQFVSTKVEKLVKSGKIPRARQDSFTKMLRNKMK